MNSFQFSNLGPYMVAASGLRFVSFIVFELRSGYVAQALVLRELEEFIIMMFLAKDDRGGRILF